MRRGANVERRATFLAAQCVKLISGPPHDNRAHSAPSPPLLSSLGRKGKRSQRPRAATVSDATHVGSRCSIVSQAESDSDEEPEYTRVTPRHERSVSQQAPAPLPRSQSPTEPASPTLPERTYSLDALGKRRESRGAWAGCERSEREGEGEGRAERTPRPCSPCV